MIKRIAALMLLGLFTGAAAMAGTCDADITKEMIEHVVHMNKGGALGKVLVASTAGDELKPALIDWALRVRSRVIAEELVANFRDRNAEPAQVDPQLADPYPLIKLEDYQLKGSIDWRKVEAHYPGTQTIVQLSRPGCDSRESFAVSHLQFHFRRPSEVAESLLFHVTKEPDSTWKVELMRHGSQETWDASDCSQYTLPKMPDYPEVCAAFTAQRSGA